MTPIISRSLLLLSLPHLGRYLEARARAAGARAIRGLRDLRPSRATVVTAGSGLYRLSGGSLDAGAAIGEHESIRTGPAAHAVLRLADGSMVDVAGAL